MQLSHGKRTVCGGGAQKPIGRNDVKQNDCVSFLDVLYCKKMEKVEDDTQSQSHVAQSGRQGKISRMDQINYTTVSRLMVDLLTLLPLVVCGRDCHAWKGISASGNGISAVKKDISWPEENVAGSMNYMI